jgi:hypothetical protein
LGLEGAGVGAVGGLGEGALEAGLGVALVGAAALLEVEQAVGALGGGVEGELDDGEESGDGGAGEALEQRVHWPLLYPLAATS